MKVRVGGWTLYWRTFCVQWNLLRSISLCSKQIVIYFGNVLNQKRKNPQKLPGMKLFLLAKTYSEIKLSQVKYKLSKYFTNYPLHVTTITLFDEEGFEAGYIMPISRQKSETSINHYSRTGESKRRRIAETISNRIRGKIIFIHHYF